MAIVGGVPRKAWYERLLILWAVAVPALAWVRGLGFYSDDWAFLVLMRMSPDQSWLGLYSLLISTDNLPVRPLQVFWLVSTYKLAPGSMLVPHVLNQMVFAAAALVLYEALRSIRRLEGGACWLVLAYVTAPHYVTARLWYANHQAGLSLLLAALVLLQMVRIRNANRAPGLLALSLLVAVTLASNLAYEILTFMLLAMPVFVWTAAGDSLRSLPRNAAFRRTMFAAFAGFALTVAFKVQVGSGLMPAHTLKFLKWVVPFVFGGATKVIFLTFGLGYPRVLWRLALGPYVVAKAWIVAAAMLAGLALFVIARPVTKRAEDERETMAVTPRYLLVAGLAAFVLAYLPFLPTAYYGGYPFGIANRENLAGAFAASLLVVALATLLNRRWPMAAIALIALWCVAGVFTQVIVASTWERAWVRQERVYADLTQAVGVPAPGSVTLLYGLCPYVGAAQVFTSSWGLSDRLMVLSHNRHQQADTIGAGARLRPDGLEVQEYGVRTVYGYERMTIYVVPERQAYRIGSYAAAQAFAAQHPLSAAAPCAYTDGGGLSLYH